MTIGRLGQLFLEAGSGSRAANVFRAALREDPTNADAHTGLGDADFALGNYRAARADFLAALRGKPGGPAIRMKLDLCNKVLLLDPTIRGLGSDERFRRSVKLLDLTLADVTRCLTSAQPMDVQDVLDKTRKILKEHVAGSRQAEAAEANLDLAEQLWRVRKNRCQSPPDASDPLTLILARMSR